MTYLFDRHNMDRARLSPNRIPSLPRGKKHWNWNPNPSVLVMHKRIHRRYGAAKNYPCVDCGKQALDWSLESKEYSDKIEDYSPRCRSCHVKKDDKTNGRGLKVSLGLKRAWAEGRR